MPLSRLRAFIARMTRSELIAVLAEKHPGLSESDAGLIVATILDGIADALASGRRTELRGFGSFGIHIRSARVSRNPKTGERVSVPARPAPVFKAGKELRERVAREPDPEDSIGCRRLVEPI